MSGVEVAAIALGAAVAKTACSVWLGDHQAASTVVGSAIDIASGRLKEARERRQFERFWRDSAERIADQIQPVIEREFRDLPENEQVAAIEAVNLTLETAKLTEEDLFRQDLDATFLQRHLAAQDPDRATRAGLSDSGSRLYDYLLEESSVYTVQVARVLPQASMTAQVELLRRSTQILERLEQALEEVPKRSADGGFERTFRQVVANMLDRLELFGADLGESKQYPLSVAYLGLTVSRRQDDEDVGSSAVFRVEDLLATSTRLFIRGQAGLGKTTLLQWIAVQSARESFSEQLTGAGWGDTVPFFLPLRRYANAELPTPDQFLREVGRHVGERMPPGWVHDQLDQGRAIVLIDGVDELAERSRDEVRRWLSELVITYPKARYVVTSRPAAVAEEWLGDSGFAVAELDPMSHLDIRVFVHRWHEAVRSRARSEAERAEIDEYEEHLLRALEERRHLRQLAGYPLLCALLCALHRDRRKQLPGDRMELYDVALQMLLERRDSERRLEPVGGTLTRTEKTLLLQDIAYWLIRNDWSDAPRPMLIDRIAKKLTAMPQITHLPAEVYRILLERSGLLREPIDGRADFIHRTFQEYLAARQAANERDIGQLIDHAHLDQWREVVVMAVGHALHADRRELLTGLLKRGKKRGLSPRHRNNLRLVALACLETSPERSPDIESAIRDAAARLLPPATVEAADALGRAGAFAVDLLATSKPETENEVVNTIRAIVAMDDPDALGMLARFARDERAPVVNALLGAWKRYDPDVFAATVLRSAEFTRRPLTVSDRALMPTLRHLVNVRGLHLEHLGSLSRPLRLDTLADMRRLALLRLTSCRVASLRPLHTSALETLVITTAINRLHTTLPMNLQDLWGLTTLTSATVFHPAVGLGGLASNRWLSTLRLWDPLLAEVDALPADLPLKAVEIAGVDVYSGLAFLNKWARSLTSLSLSGNRCTTLTGLAALTSLDRLRLNFNSPVDLSHLTGMSALRVLVLDGAAHMIYDLTPLRGATDLTVRVAQGRILTEFALGGGIRVVKSPTCLAAELAGPQLTTFQR